MGRLDLCCRQPGRLDMTLFRRSHGSRLSRRRDTVNCRGLMTAIWEALSPLEKHSGPPRVPLWSAPRRSISLMKTRNQRRGTLRSETKVDGRHRRVYGQVKGNNTFGKRGKLSCTQCRKIRSKVLPRRNSATNRSASTTLSTSHVNSVLREVTNVSKHGALRNPYRHTNLPLAVRPPKSCNSTLPPPAPPPRPNQSPSSRQPYHCYSTLTSQTRNWI